jgi:hypothetical protein
MVSFATSPVAENTSRSGAVNGWETTAITCLVIKTPLSSYCNDTKAVQIVPMPTSVVIIAAFVMLRHC